MGQWWEDAEKYSVVCIHVRLYTLQEREYSQIQEEAGFNVVDRRCWTLFNDNGNCYVLIGLWRRGLGCTQNLGVVRLLRLG